MRKRATSYVSFSPSGMAVSPEGDLICGGWYSGGSSNYSIGVLAIKPSGTPDSSFGSSGLTVQNFKSALMVPGYSPVAVNADGKIFVGRAVTSYSSGYTA